MFWPDTRSWRSSCVCRFLDFTLLYAVALGILYTHSFSLQLAIPTIPSSPTTSLHSSHQDSTRSKAVISAIHTWPFGPPSPKENASHDTARSHAKPRGKICKRDTGIHSFACNCSGAVLAVAATVPGPDVIYKREVKKVKKKGIGQRGQNISVRETLTGKMRG